MLLMGISIVLLFGKTPKITLVVPKIQIDTCTTISERDTIRVITISQKK
jgi:hypothetical protein